MSNCIKRVLETFLEVVFPSVTDVSSIVVFLHREQCHSGRLCACLWARVGVSLEFTSRWGISGTHRLCPFNMFGGVRGPPTCHVRECSLPVSSLVP